MRIIRTLLAQLLIVLAFPILSLAGTVEELSKYEIILINDVEDWQLNKDQGVDVWNAATSTFIAKCYQRGLKTANLSSFGGNREELKKFDSTRVLFAISTWAHLKTKKLFRDAYEVRATIYFKNTNNEVVFTASSVSTKRDWKQALQVSFLESYDQFLAAHPGFDKNTNYLEKKKAAGPVLSRSSFIREFQDRIDSLKPIEGLWATFGSTNGYDNFEIAIIRQYGSDLADYVGYLTKTTEPKQLVGHLRMTLTDTAVDGVFQGMLVDNQSVTTESIELVQTSLNSLAISVKSRSGNEPKELNLIRIFPKYEVKGDSQSAAPVAPKDPSAEVEIAGSGSGFLVDSGKGLVVTNYHVIENGKKLRVVFPVAGEEYDCSVLTADSVNDLAILRLIGFEKSSLYGQRLPFKLSPSSTISEGTRVFTIGYPLGALLGTQPKYSDGSVSSMFGINGDPRIIQINAPIQPGNSGGPLFTADGRLIGIVVAALDAKYFIEKAGILPQNVNFAVKSDYLTVLLGVAGSVPRDSAEPLAEAELIQVAKAFTVSIQNWQ